MSVAIYFWGKNKNKLIMQSWIKYNKKYFEQQFDQIGIKTENGQMINYEEESSNHFKFYATGRNNCNYVLVNIETKKRHVRIIYPNFLQQKFFEEFLKFLYQNSHIYLY